MSAELEIEPTEQPQTEQPKTIDRVGINIAVGSYLRAVQRFEDASNAFNAACTLVRETVPRCKRFVVKYDFRYYLITTEKDGSFEVEEIELC